MSASMNQRKPYLRRVGGQWACTAHGCGGLGATMAQAYERWRARATMDGLAYLARSMPHEVGRQHAW